MPTPILSGKTPYGILIQKQPTYDHLRVFGCLCYVHNNDTHRHKFAQHSRRSVFVGYSLSQRGYRVFDLKTKTIYTNRDAIFREEEFPFKNPQPIQTHTHVVPKPIQDTFDTSPLHTVETGHEDARVPNSSQISHTTVLSFPYKFATACNVDSLVHMSSHISFKTTYALLLITIHYDKNPSPSSHP